MVSHWGQFWGPILFSLYAPTGSSPPPESDYPNVHCDAEDTMVWHQGNKVTFSLPQNDQNLNLMIINYIFTHYYRCITLCSTEAEVEWVGRPGWGWVPVPCSRAVLLNWSFFLSASWIRTRNKIFSEELPAWSNEYTHGQSGARTRDLGVNRTNEPRGPRGKKMERRKDHRGEQTERDFHTC